MIFLFVVRLFVLLSTRKLCLLLFTWNSVLSLSTGLEKPPPTGLTWFFLFSVNITFSCYFFGFNGYILCQIWKWLDFLWKGKVQGE